jgi:hypothetical protein
MDELLSQLGPSAEHFKADGGPGFKKKYEAGVGPQFFAILAGAADSKCHAVMYDSLIYGDLDGGEQFDGVAYFADGLELQRPCLAAGTLEEAPK